MSDQKPEHYRLIALALGLSAVALGVVSALIFAGTVPVSDDNRKMIGAAVGAAAGADLLICTWFFRKGQSS